ncbi:hypothetical protein MY4038_003018 [Beauveria bassiana]
MPASSRDSLCSFCQPQTQCTHQGHDSISFGRSPASDSARPNALDLPLDPSLECPTDPLRDNDWGRFVNDDTTTAKHTETNQARGSPTSPLFHYYRPDLSPQNVTAAQQTTTEADLVRHDLNGHVTRPSKRKRYDDAADCAGTACLEALEEQLRLCVQRFTRRAVSMMLSGIDEAGNRFTLHIGAETSE